MDVVTHAKFHFSWLMLTLIFSIQASELPQAWRMTEKARPDRVNSVRACTFFSFFNRFRVRYKGLKMSYSQVDSRPG